jgi:hypothetical protein
MTIETASDDEANVTSVLLSDGADWHPVQSQSFCFVELKHQGQGFSFRELVGPNSPMEVLTEGPISTLLALRRRIKQ